MNTGDGTLAISGLQTSLAASTTKREDSNGHIPPLYCGPKRESQSVRCQWAFPVGFCTYIIALRIHYKCIILWTVDTWYEKAERRLGQQLKQQSSHCLIKIGIGKHEHPTSTTNLKIKLLGIPFHRVPHLGKQSKTHSTNPMQTNYVCMCKNNTIQQSLSPHRPVW